MKTPREKKGTKAGVAITDEAGNALAHADYIQAAPEPEEYLWASEPRLISGIGFRALAERHPKAPRKRPHSFDKEQVEDVAVALRFGMNVMLTGPTGCGKTSLPIAIAHELGHPLVRFNLDGDTRVSNLRGMNVPASDDGVLTLKFSAGALTECLDNGYWVVLDEIDAALSSVRFVLQPVLEEGNRSLYVPETGRTHAAADGFAVFATANTVGYRAMARASHSGTSSLNAALLDRFGMVIACGYPEKDEECERVRMHSSCDPEIIDGICRVAKELRADTKFKSDFSTRRCIQWAQLSDAYGIDGVLRAAERSVIRKFESAVDAKIAREVICRIFGYPQGTTTP